MNRRWLIPGIILGALLLLILTVGGGYNGLVNKREAVRKSLANIQTQYQRRADLIPNLVNTVKGAANFEQKTLVDVIDARAKATSVQIDPSKATPEQLQAYQASQGQLSQALGRLLVVSENYPQLRATEAFKDLQSQLEGTENRITVARKDFNDVASDYNAQIQRFPSSISASLFGFHSFPYFEASAAAQNAPQVDFGK